MPTIKITRANHPDHDGADIHCYSDTGAFLGTFKFDGKGNSRFELAPDQPHYKPIRLKKKHRA